jgi:hypothetical protein
MEASMQAKFELVKQYLQEMLSSLTIEHALKWQDGSFNNDYILSVANLDPDLKHTGRWVRKIKQRLTDILSEET